MLSMGRVLELFLNKIVARGIRIGLLLTLGVNSFLFATENKATNLATNLKEELIWKSSVPKKVHILQPVQTVFNKEGKFILNVALPKGWKINQQAPSRLGFFKIGSNAAFLVLDQKQLGQKNILIDDKNFSQIYLPTKKFRLQGTLYICEKEGGLCQSKIVEGEVRVDDRSGVTEKILIQVP